MSVEHTLKPPALSATVLASPAPGSVARTRSTQRDTVRVLVGSRLLIWLVGCPAVLLLGTSAPERRRFDPAGISQSLGSLGNVLAAPVVRWDAIWYLQIAHHGYQTQPMTRFFPAFPLLAAALSGLVGSAWIAGLLISVLASIVGLELVRRLTELELGGAAAWCDRAIGLRSSGPVLLGRLHRIAVPGAVGRHVVCRPTAKMGDGRCARRRRGRHPRHRCSAGRTGAVAVSVWPARRQSFSSST